MGVAHRHHRHGGAIGLQSWGAHAAILAHADADADPTESSGPPNAVDTTGPRRHSARVTTSDDLELLSLTNADLPAWTERTRRRLVDQRVRGGWREADARVRADRTLDRAVTESGWSEGQHVWRVRQGGADVGDVWLMLTRGADAHVVAVDVPEQAAGATFDVVARAAGALGVKRLMISCFPGDRVTDAFLAGRSTELVATQMELTLVEPAPEERVRLERMTPERYTAFLDTEIEHYAREMLESGSHQDLETARADSRRQHAQLLPAGLDTPRQLLWSAFDGDREVGILWINVDGDRAFIYDIEVDERCRRQGYGGAILRAGAHESAARGAVVLGLNVFGPNAGARALYEKSGFATIERIVIVEL